MMASPQAAWVDVDGGSPPRKFTILDAMVLVGVTALGLAWNQWSSHDFPIFDVPYLRNAPVHRLFNRALWYLVPHLAFWTLALLTLGIRRPIRESIARPGLAACAAATLAILFEAAWFIPFKIGHPGGLGPYVLTVHHCERVGFAVAGAWLILWAGNLWRPTRSWIDRVGCLIGVSWLAVSIAYNFRNLFN